MRVLITCGPSSEKIDAVRRIVNQSTGELGAMLAAGLQQWGHEVVCLRGMDASHPPPSPPVRVESFTGNRDLETLLERHAGWPDLVLHAAALADFFPQEIRAGGESTPCGEGKLSSDHNEVLLVLQRAPKLIARLRGLFPDAFLVGWKYEVTGSEAGAIARARAMIVDHKINCVVANGPVFGRRLLWVMPNSGEIELTDKTALLKMLRDFELSFAP